MLKFFIHIFCDDCGQPFIFARESPYNTDAVSFNTKALMAMLPTYFWEHGKNDEGSFQYCQECCFNFPPGSPESGS
jgi:hypothetical protein